MPGRRTYNTAASAWPRSGRLVIESVLDTTIAKFPLNFLETCGDNTWSYVSYVVSLLVEADPQYPGHIVWPENGHPVDSRCAPVAGMFKYVEQGPSTEHIVGIASLSVTGKSSDVHFTRGPTYYTSVIPASGQEGTSVSRSTRSSADQSDFKMNLISRDSDCPVSGSRWQDCHASHIVPYSRPDVYEQIDGNPDEMFSPKAGLLLDMRLHRAYDALSWSFYRKGDTFYVHYFYPIDPWRCGLNGKAIPPSRFHGQNEPPDPALAAWHYAQTVQARIRGFASGLSRDE